MSGKAIKANAIVIASSPNIHIQANSQPKITPISVFVSKLGMII